MTKDPRRKQAETDQQKRKLHLLELEEIDRPHDRETEEIEKDWIAKRGKDWPEGLPKRIRPIAWKQKALAAKTGSHWPGYLSTELWRLVLPIHQRLRRARIKREDPSAYVCRAVTETYHVLASDSVPKLQGVEERVLKDVLRLKLPEQVLSLAQELEWVPRGNETELTEWLAKVLDVPAEYWRW